MSRVHRSFTGYIIKLCGLGKLHSFLGTRWRYMKLSTYLHFVVNCTSSYCMCNNKIIRSIADGCVDIAQSDQFSNYFLFLTTILLQFAHLLLVDNNQHRFRAICCGALQYPLASTASVAVHLVSAQLFSGLIWIGISMMENLFSTCRSIMAFTVQLLKIIIPFRLASQPSTHRRRSRTDCDCASARLIVCPHRMCLSCTPL